MKDRLCECFGFSVCFGGSGLYGLLILVCFVCVSAS
jgi:hypothetical protein